MTRTWFAVFALAVLTASSATADPSPDKGVQSQLKGGKDLLEKSGKVTEEVLERLLRRDFELAERERRARNFNPTFTTAVPRAVDGDRVFGKDPVVRKQARDEYASFLEKEARDVERLKARRDEQAGHMREVEGRYKGLLSLIEKTPEIIDRSSRLPVVNGILTPQLRKVLEEAKQNQPIARGLVNEYRRIVSQYDNLIQKAELEHEGHTHVLEAIDAVQGAAAKLPDQGRFSQAPSAESVGHLGAPTSVARAPLGTDVIGERLASTVSQSTGAVHARADQLRSSVESMKIAAAPLSDRASGSPRAMHSPMVVVPLESPREPAWRGYITPLSRP